MRQFLDTNITLRNRRDHVIYSREGKGELRQGVNTLSVSLTLETSLEPVRKARLPGLKSRSAATKPAFAGWPMAQSAKADFATAGRDFNPGPEQRTFPVRLLVSFVSLC